MKLVTKAEFLKMPEGTVFARYRETGVFFSICIKRATLPDNDFYYADLIGVDCDNVLEAWIVAEGDPTFEIKTRLCKDILDGPGDDDEQYCVFSADEVQTMIAALQTTQSTPPTDR